MKKIYLKCLLFIFIVLTIFSTGCIQENSGLVNPPLVTETVQIRFLNMASDKMPRTLTLERTTTYDDSEYGLISSPNPPPYDSVSIHVLNNDIVEYSSLRKFRLARNCNYILIATPSASDDTSVVAVDSVISLQTSIIKPQDTNQCYIKFLNMNPDKQVTYSIKSGCPNGEDVFIDNAVTYFTYRHSSGVQSIYDGKKVFSIIKNQSGISGGSNTELVGIFELDLKRLGQYVLIVNDADEVFFVDELNTDQISLQPLEPISEREAFVRVVNFSTESVSVNKVNSGELATNLNPLTIDKYGEISTCETTTLDKIELLRNGLTTDSTNVSFNINNRYSFFVFDTKSKSASRIIFVPPIDERYPILSNKCIVRVINANSTDVVSLPESNKGINVSIGAYTAIDNEFGYVSGTILANSLQAGEVSQPVSINAGNVPIAIFSAMQPTKYIFSSVLSLENGKEYVISVDFSKTEPHIVAVENSEELVNISYNQNASFIQVVNAVNGNNDSIDVTIPGIIDNGEIINSNSIATFIPVGDISITASNKTLNINATETKRTLVVATSDASNADLFAVQSSALGATSTRIRYRFINAASDIPFLTIKSDSTTVLNSDVAYREASQANEYPRDYKFTFYFTDQTGKELFRASDLLMTLNKNYSIVFTGSQKSGYKVIVLQEY